MGEVFAVEFFGGFGSPDLIEGPIEVEGAEDGGVVGAACLVGGHQSRSPDDERGANAAFIHPGFGSPEGIGSSGTGLVAIVGTDRNDGVVTEFGIITDPIEETGELLVHGVKNALVEDAFVATPFVEWWPEGAVDVIGPEVDKEGFFLGLCFVDESESGIDEACRDFETLHPFEAVTKAFGVFPDAAFDGFAAIGIWFESERKELGAHALEVG